MTDTTWDTQTEYPPVEHAEVEITGSQDEKPKRKRGRKPKDERVTIDASTLSIEQCAEYLMRAKKFLKSQDVDKDDERVEAYRQRLQQRRADAETEVSQWVENLNAVATGQEIPHPDANIRGDIAVS